MLKHPLMLRIEPRSLRRYLVHDSHIRYQIVNQQVLDEIAADETASCNRKRIKVCRSAVLSLFRSARPARHRYIARYLTSQHDHPRFLITGGRCHGRLSFNCSTVRLLAGARCLRRKDRQTVSSWSMALPTHYALSTGLTAVQLT